MAEDIPVTNPVEVAPPAPTLPAAGPHEPTEPAPAALPSPGAGSVAAADGHDREAGESPAEVAVSTEELPSGAPVAAEHPEEETPNEAEEGEDPAAATDDAEEAPAEAPPENNKRWYVVKVQSGREESIKDAVERRVKIEGLEEYFGQIHIPTEKVTEVRNGKRVTKEKKLYPGYIMAEVEYNDRILYLFRETSGVGDFVGGTLNRPPSPMSEREIERMMGQKVGGQPTKEVAPKPKFDVGDRVRVTDGTFKGMEGEVKEILEALARVRVELTIFGRGVPVELEYWQVEQV